MTGQVIHNDERGVVAELAFQRHAVMAPHSNPNTTLFVVISGGGYVQVGEERARVNHGEAVVWPPQELHGAYTDGSEMRVIVVELPEAPGPAVVLEGTALLPAGMESSARPSPANRPSRGEGRLADRTPTLEEHRSAEGEPW